MHLRAQVAADLPLAVTVAVRSEAGRKTIMEALDALPRGEGQLQAHMRDALAELGQWVTTTATLPLPMDTDLERKDTLDGLLSKFEFEGEAEEAKLSAEEKRGAYKKTKLE